MASSLAPAPLRQLQVYNRKFIGAKTGLLDFIDQVVTERAPDAATAADLFAGSSVVAHRLAQRGMAVLANDHLYSNYLAARAFLTTHAGNADLERVAERIAQLNALPGEPGYASRHFGGTYFTPENAARIDAIREQIARWRAEGRINGQEEALLITSLLYAADKVANTCGQYDAYLKHLGRPAYAADGTHLVDACVYHRLELALPVPLPDGERHRAACCDANELASRITADLVYLDPPYNTRQYVDNYHVLENIARWEKPPVCGKTAKFDRRALKSRYSSRVHAGAALADLIRRLRCRHILLSYNNEGIVPDSCIATVLKERGEVEVYSRDYSVFGNGAGRSRRRPIVERLFHCRVTRPPI